MNHNHSQGGGHTTHLILMLLCCLIPIALILAVSIFGLSLGPLAPYLPFAMVILCPLMMFFMMRGMGQEHDAGTHHATNTMPQARASERSENAAVTMRDNELDSPQAASAGATTNQKSCH